MSYVDGFVIPAPKNKVAAYKKMATWGKKMWMKHGALQYFECVADDLKVMPGCGSFHDMVKLKRGETLWYSFIIYKNKAHRCVKRPSKDPSGATAKCRDGTYSYSQHASGTCSHHGGVARWIHHPRLG